MKYKSTIWDLIGVLVIILLLIAILVKILSWIGEIL